MAPGDAGRRNWSILNMFEETIYTKNDRPGAPGDAGRRNWSISNMFEYKIFTKMIAQGRQETPRGARRRREAQLIDF